MEAVTIANALALLFGIILLWWSGDKAVRYALSASHLFGFSKVFIGFAFLAISTGLPELFVAIVSLIRAVPALSVGDVIGSNFTDISLVLGLPVIFVGSIRIQKAEKPILLNMLIVIAILMGTVLFLGKLSRWHGLFLMAVYFLCIWRVWKTRHAREVMEEEAERLRIARREEEYLRSRLGTLLKLAGSLILLIVASEISVFFGVAFAKSFKISHEILGCTFLALGTSLPELTLNVHAIRRGEFSMAIGNSFGSILEQGALILGILAFLSPMPLNIVPMRTIAPFMFLSFGIVGFGLFVRNKLNRPEGILLLCLFILFWLYNYSKMFYLAY